jgi:hypothetical protein
MGVLEFEWVFQNEEDGCPGIRMKKVGVLKFGIEKMGVLDIPRDSDPDSDPDPDPDPDPDRSR